VRLRVSVCGSRARFLRCMTTAVRYLGAKILSAVVLRKITRVWLSHQVMKTGPQKAKASMC